MIPTTPTTARSLPPPLPNLFRETFFKKIGNFFTYKRSFSWWQTKTNQKIKNKNKYQKQKRKQTQNKRHTSSNLKHELQQVNTKHTLAPGSKLHHIYTTYIRLKKTVPAATWPDSIGVRGRGGGMQVLKAMGSRGHNFGATWHAPSNPPLTPLPSSFPPPTH